jgi:hypothetical protein
VPCGRPILINVRIRYRFPGTGWRQPGDLGRRGRCARRRAAHRAAGAAEAEAKGLMEHSGFVIVGPGLTQVPAPWVMREWFASEPGRPTWRACSLDEKADSQIRSAASV